MPFNFGAFAGGLSQGMREGQKMQLEAEAHKLKAKMLDAQMKAMEFDQQEKQRKAAEQANQQIELGKYVDMLGKGVQQGGAPGYESPEQQMSVAPVPEYRPATQPELLGQGLKAVPQEHRYNLIQQSMKGPGGTGAQSLAFATPQDAVAFQGTPSFKALYPYGARLTQTSRGFAFTGVDPVNAADNTFHRVLTETGDRDKATAARNAILYGSSAMTGAGGVSGKAAATLGEPVAPPPGFPPANQVQPSPATPGPVTPSISSMSVGDLLKMGQGGSALAPQPSGPSPALRAKTAEETAKFAGRPLDSADRTAIGAMESTMRIAQDLKQNFTQDDLNKYVGFLKFPANRLGQLAKADPKFAQFQTLVNQVKGTAFSEGGKQLTPFEAGITFGHIPTGTEFSTADFVAKLDNTIKETQNRINDRLRMSSQPRGQVSSPGAQPRKMRFNPQTGKIE